LTRVLLDKASVPLAPPFSPTADGTCAERRLETIEALCNATSDRALAFGLDPLLAITAAGLLLGRRCMLVGGASAAQLSTVIADALGGQRVYRVRMSPTLFCVSDLLAVPVAAVGSDEVAPLGDRLADAAAHTEVAVLILQGCNRAPPEGVLADLLEGVTPGAGGLLTPWVDRRGVFRGAKLDGRLLVVGTLVEGSTSFRVPEALAARVPLIDADRRMFEAELPVLECLRRPRSATRCGTRSQGPRRPPSLRLNCALRSAMSTARPHCARYFGIAYAVLADSSAAFESLLAMTIGRPVFERPEVLRVLGTDRASGEDVQASHRRLAPLIEMRVAC
jgi:hypothetical protein